MRSTCAQYVWAMMFISRNEWRTHCTCFLACFIRRQYSVGSDGCSKFGPAFFRHIRCWD